MLALLLAYFLFLIQRAAKLRPRHRAKTKSSKAANSVYLSICLLSVCLRLSKNPSKMVPNSFQIVAKMVKNRGLEGVWCCFVACLRPKAPVGRFLDSSWAALGASWAPVGWLLGRLGRQAGAFKGVLKAA